MPTSTLSSKGQVTIPKEVRDALHLDAGDRVLFVVREDGVVELRPQTVDLRDLVGMLKPPEGKHLTVEEMDEAIGEAVVASYRRSVEE
ncbi:MAG: AbrB/MazE/SpoVT family DNA-binding domain-containing protein [Pseudomonadota bacterium]|nr:AbrB/MazE/SpoVT family DNA-binding domain-containing protein [Pseudomonadota bacterium]